MKPGQSFDFSPEQQSPAFVAPVLPSTDVLGAPGPRPRFVLDDDPFAPLAPAAAQPRPEANTRELAALQDRAFLDEPRMIAVRRAVLDAQMPTTGDLAEIKAAIQNPILASDPRAIGATYAKALDLIRRPGGSDLASGFKAVVDDSILAGNRADYANWKSEFADAVGFPNIEDPVHPSSAPSPLRPLRVEALEDLPAFDGPSLFTPASPEGDSALSKGIPVIELELKAPEPAPEVLAPVAVSQAPESIQDLLDFTFEPESVSRDQILNRPLLDVAMDRRYQFTDPATPAVLAAIPPAMGQQETVLSYGQLRALASNVIQSLNDMDSATDQGFSRLPPAEQALERATAIINELRTGSPGLSTPPYLREVPRTNPALDLLDKNLRLTAFPDEWKEAFGSNLPPVAFKLTPEGRAVGELVQARSADPVLGFGPDHSEVKLPSPLAQVAFAGADARGEMRLDYYDAGLMGPGDLGREFVMDAWDLRSSASGLDLRDPDVIGGRVIDVLDSVSMAANYVANTEELDTPVADFAIRGPELRDTLLLSRDTVAANPVLATDEFINERFSQALGAYQGLQVIEQAKALVARDGLAALLRPGTYQLVPTEVDLRPAAAAPGVQEAFLAAKVNPLVAESPLGNYADVLVRKQLFVESWLTSSVSPKDRADFVDAMYLGTQAEAKGLIAETA